MLKELLETIRRETQPIAGHTDPGAIEDCWRSVFEELEAVEHSVHLTPYPPCGCGEKSIPFINLPSVCSQCGGRR